jgi:hypothetical protein
MGKKRKKVPESNSDSGSIFRKESEKPFFTRPEGLGEGKGLGATKSRMESALGEDLSEVRIHTDSAAEQLNRKQSSDAVTMGQDIAFGPGKFKPGSFEGDALLAHELAHTIQQKEASPDAAPKADHSPSLERDADTTAVGVLGRLFGRKKWSKTKAIQAHGLQHADDLLFWFKCDRARAAFLFWRTFSRHDG